MTAGERARVERLCRGVEARLRCLGGPELLDDARREAERYACLNFYWDESGDEPLVRMRARMDILSMRLERAREPGGGLA